MSSILLFWVTMKLGDLKSTLLAASAATLAGWWLYNRIRFRHMPPFLPLRELGLLALAYPLLGHAPLIRNPERLRQLVRKYGARVGSGGWEV